MSVIVDKDRISRWKCLVCGSKSKKKIDLYNKSNKIVGYSLFCCNCGHVDNFAWSMNAAKELAGVPISTIERGDVHCAVLHKDIKYCERRDCPYRPKPPKKEERTVNYMPEEPPKSDVRPEIEPLPENPLHRGVPSPDGYNATPPKRDVIPDHLPEPTQRPVANPTDIRQFGYNMYPQSTRAIQDVMPIPGEDYLDEDRIPVRMGTSLHNSNSTKTIK